MRSVLITFLFSLLAVAGNAVAASLPQTIEKARSGDISAMHNLGARYANGEEVEQDYAKAMDWFRRAALLGQHNSMYSLAVMYHMGQGVEIDLVRAYAWYSLAAQYIPKDADEWFIPRAKVAMYQMRPIEVEAMLNAEQVVEARKVQNDIASQIRTPSNSPLHTDAIQRR